MVTLTRTYSQYIEIHGIIHLIICISSQTAQQAILFCFMPLLIIQNIMTPNTITGIPPLDVQEEPFIT